MQRDLAAQLSAVEFHLKQNGSRGQQLWRGMMTDPSSIPVRSLWGMSFHPAWDEQFDSFQTCSILDGDLSHAGPSSV